MLSEVQRLEFNSRKWKVKDSRCLVEWKLVDIWSHFGENRVENERKVRKSEEKGIRPSANISKIKPFRSIILFQRHLAWECQ